MDDGAIEIIEPYEEEKPAPKPVEKKPVGESILKKSITCEKILFFLTFVIIRAC